MKTLKYFVIFTMAFYLTSCNKDSVNKKPINEKPVIDSTAQVLNCEDWVNDSNIDFLTRAPQHKQMFSSLSNIESQIEEGISYVLYLKENADKGITSIPFSEVVSNAYTGAFSGFIFFKPKESGNYHVIVSQRVWIDFIDEDTQQAVTSTAYTEAECGNDFINKVVQFPLEKGKRYILYLVNTDKSAIKAIIKR